MRKLIFFTFIGCLCALNAQARLGWTLEQCRQQYGPEKTKLEEPELHAPAYVFETKYFEVTATILDGKVEMMKYHAKPDPDAWINTEEFKFYTQAIINDILEKNLGKQKLIRSPEDDFQGSLGFRTKDGTQIYIDSPTKKFEETDPPAIEITSAKMSKMIDERITEEAVIDRQKAAQKPREITKGL
jgi:hypothetical protein